MSQEGIKKIKGISLAICSVNSDLMKLMIKLITKVTNRVTTKNSTLIALRLQCYLSKVQLRTLIHGGYNMDTFYIF